MRSIMAMFRPKGPDAGPLYAAVVAAFAFAVIRKGRETSEQA